MNDLDGMDTFISWFCPLAKEYAVQGVVTPCQGMGQRPMLFYTRTGKTIILLNK